jgi:hypothetical protein
MKKIIIRELPVRLIAEIKQGPDIKEGGMRVPCPVLKWNASQSGCQVNIQEVEGVGDPIGGSVG